MLIESWRGGIAQDKRRASVGAFVSFFLFPVVAGIGKCCDIHAYALKQSMVVWRGIDWLRRVTVLLPLLSSFECLNSCNACRQAMRSVSIKMEQFSSVMRIERDSSGWTYAAFCGETLREMSENSFLK